jgi:hypothetical protein
MQIRAGDASRPDGSWHPPGATPEARDAAVIIFSTLVNPVRPNEVHTVRDVSKIDRQAA